MAYGLKISSQFSVPRSRLSVAGEACTIIWGFSGKVELAMLDLNFVRENLALVEEKLRQRGMDPAAVLQDFSEVDARRREAITAAETMKAERNRKSEEIARLKKSKQDAEALVAETKQLRELIQEREKNAEHFEVRLRD